MLLIQTILFLFAAVIITYLSLKSLRRKGSHGYYRFFVFIGVTLVVVLNIPYWFREPASPIQLASWILLLISLFLLQQSFYFLRKIGGSAVRKSGESNFEFENTANLVVTGIYKYIRHPMYASLLFLCAGALLKDLNPVTGTLALVVLCFLVLTAKAEEQENIEFFGEEYKEFMKRTKMFVPFIY